MFISLCGNKEGGQYPERPVMAEPGSSLSPGNYTYKLVALGEWLCLSETQFPYL